MTVSVGHLYRKRTVRNLSGQVIDMLDETDGSGVIISKGRVMNEEKVIEINKKEEDRKLAATAFTQEVQAPPEIAEQRVIAPTKMQEMEKDILSLKTDITSILDILKNKK